MAADATILHCDLDAFYASVEQMLDPSLKGKPVLVGGGVVMAASYEAKARGIRTPMNLNAALARCPDAVVRSGSFAEYSRCSEEVMAILGDFTPEVEQISIDEAFLDVSGTIHLLGTPEEIGAEIRRRVQEEVGIPISVGVARTKFLAKVASAQSKPNGLLVVDPETELEWLHSLPVGVIWGVGPVTEGKLANRGIATVGELAETPAASLVSWLGPGAGNHLHDLAWNRDPRPVVTSRRAKSIGAQSALGRGMDDDEELSNVLHHLADRVATRLRAKGKEGRTITVRVRFPDMTAITRSHTISTPTNVTDVLHRVGERLLADCRDTRQEPLTLVGISVANLGEAGIVQLDLGLEPGDVTDAGSTTSRNRAAIDAQIDAARDRFGRVAVGRASDLLPAAQKRVADDFRTLAEKD